MKIHKNIKNYIQEKGLKLTLLAAAFLAVLTAGFTAFAWGPERTTFTIESPATYVTFNSITNNPNYGDERNFTIARGVDEDNTKWRDTLDITTDGDYLIRIYVHNNAASNYNLVSNNTRAIASIPSELTNKVEVNGMISSANANPATIWDQVVFQSASKKFSLAYIAGSARYYNNYNASEGFALPDSIVTNSGALLGYQTMDGNIPGCYEYSGIVTLKVRATLEKASDFTVEKKVRLNGTDEWNNTSITVKPGDKIDYQIGYKNTGETTQNNVMVLDRLPAGVTYLNGTTTVKNSNYPDGNGLTIESNEVIANGINISNYTPGANAFVRFTATIPQAKDLSCGENKLINTATVVADGNSKQDTVEVVVNVECEPSECKPGIPEGDPKCNEEPEVPITPVTELPTTGPLEAGAAIIAVLAITVGVVYWYKSHQALKQAATRGAKSANHKEKPLSHDGLKEDKPQEGNKSLKKDKE